MKFSTSPAIVALLMSSGVLAKSCGKNKNNKHHPTTLSTSVVPATSTVSLLAEISSIFVNPTSTASSNVVAVTSSTLSTSSVAATTTSSSSAAATTTTTSSSSSLTSDQQEAVSVQNSARSDVSETALTWDDTLASDALAWAQHLASAGGSAGTLTHSSGTGQGENLYWQSDSDSPYANAANAWVDEKSEYDGEAITGTGNFENYGHYSMWMMPWNICLSVRCC